MRPWLGHVGRCIDASVTGFFRDGSPQSAAAISYYAVFSLFPIAILTVTVFGLVVSGADARQNVIAFLLDNLPITGTGARQLQDILTNVTSNAEAFGIVGLLGLLFSASGLMGAVRNALNRAWGVEQDRPPAQAKGLDVLLVLGVAGLVALSFGLTVVERVALGASAGLRDALGPLATSVPRILIGQVVPILIAFGVFALLFRVVPATRVRLRDAWPGALVAALGYEGTKTGFAFYLENFDHYGVVYGSLATVVTFMVFVFLAANLFLLGAEVAVEWPRTRVPGPPGEPFARRVLGFLRGLFVRAPSDRPRPVDAPGASRPRD